MNFSPEDSNSFRNVGIHNLNNELIVMNINASSDNISLHSSSNDTNVDIMSIKTLLNKDQNKELHLSAFDGSTINPIIKINNTHQYVNIMSNLNVNSNLNVTSNLNVATNLNVANNLNVMGDTKLSGNLNITDSSTLQIKTNQGTATGIIEFDSGSNLKIFNGDQNNSDDRATVIGNYSPIAIQEGLGRFTTIKRDSQEMVTFQETADYPIKMKEKTLIENDLKVEGIGYLEGLKVIPDGNTQGYRSNNLIFESDTDTCTLTLGNDQNPGTTSNHTSFNNFLRGDDICKIILAGCGGAERICKISNRLLLPQGNSPGNTSNPSLVFSTGKYIDPHTTYVDHMVIREYGKIGIGTLSPAEKLHVVGNVKVEGIIISDEGKTQIKKMNDSHGAIGSNLAMTTNSGSRYALGYKDDDANSNTYLNCSGSGAIYFTIDGNPVGAPYCDGTTFFTYGGSPVTSDDRLKFNETLLSNVTETLLKLRPQLYDKANILINPTSYKKEAGLIVQEIYYEIPELRYLITIPDDAVLIDDNKYRNFTDIQNDPDYSNWGSSSAYLNYNDFITYLIAGFQEHNTRIVNLETENTTLKSDNELLKTQVNELTNIINKLKTANSFEEFKQSLN